MRFAGGLQPLADPRRFAEHLRPARKIAISNQRLCSLDDGTVRFHYTDYRSNGASRHKTMTLAATEFIRRMLLHVLPPGFHRIRYYGFLANRARQQKLAECRRALCTPPPPEPQQDAPVTDYRHRYEALTGRSLRQCPRCHAGNMQPTDHLAGAWACPAILAPRQPAAPRSPRPHAAHQSASGAAAAGNDDGPSPGRAPRRRCPRLAFRRTSVQSVNRSGSVSPAISAARIARPLAPRMSATTRVSVGVFQRLLQPLRVPRDLAYELLAGPRQVAQFLNRGRRHEAALNQPVRQQVGQLQSGKLTQCC